MNNYTEIIDTIYRQKVTDIISEIWMRMVTDDPEALEVLARGLRKSAEIRGKILEVLR
jgi:hypothetical protein